MRIDFSIYKESGDPIEWDYCAEKFYYQKTREDEKIELTRVVEAKM